MSTLIIAILVGIVISLGQAGYAMASGNGASAQMAKALTIRIALSLALFVFLMIGWYFGLLTPHNVG